MKKWGYSKDLGDKVTPINTGFLSIREWVEINFCMFGLCKVIKVCEGWDVIDKYTGEILYFVRKMA